MKIIKIKCCHECPESWYDRTCLYWKCGRIYPEDLIQINISNEVHPDCPLEDYKGDNNG